MTKRRHHWTDEDAAFAALQWCSGIKQREIAGHFGYRGPGAICNEIERFIRKYYTGVPLMAWTRDLNGVEVNCIAQGDDRKLLAKIAFCHFMAQREEHAA